MKRFVAEQILFVEKRWDNIAEHSEQMPPGQHQLNIVKERLEDYKKNPNNKRSWEEFKGDYLR